VHSFWGEAIEFAGWRAKDQRKLRQLTQRLLNIDSYGTPQSELPSSTIVFIPLSSDDCKPAQEGWSALFVHAGEADQVVAELKGIGGNAIAIQADVSSAPDVERLFNETVKRLGSLDVVVHNSGIMPLSPIGKNEVDLFDKVISTNLRGAFLVLAQAAQHIATGGRIIAFSSSVLAKSFPTYGPYIASKAGVEGLVHVLANELRGRNVTVNAVAPGPVATELFLKGKSEEQVAEIAKMAPLERLGQPDDIASVVSFLAGADAGWVNSQVLRANGGFAY
jgi:3-oxoacyl-[acyl-carrier protein] reductase